MAEPAAAPDRKQAAERHGRRAETIAAWFLRLKGYRIIERRFKTPVGEIDLIVSRGRALAFVEVKARPSARDGLEAITAAGRVRIARAAEYWLSRHPEALALTLRFDAVAIVPRRWPVHLANAFDGNGRA